MTNNSSMKGAISTITMILIMVSWIMMPLIGIACILGFFVACFYLIVLLIHLLLPKLNVNRIIKPPNADSSPAIKRTNVILVLIPITWLFIYLLSLLNAWYQEGHYMQFQAIAICTFVFLLEYSVFYGSQKWNSLKWKGLSPVLLCILIPCFYFFILKGNFPLTSKIEDLRFQQDLPQYSQLLKQVESKNILNASDIRNFPIPENFPASSVFVKKSEKGTLIVGIITGSFGMGSNGIAWGYAYVSDDHIEGVKYFVKTRKIQSHWFRYVYGG